MKEQSAGQRTEPSDTQIDACIPDASEPDVPDFIIDALARFFLSVSDELGEPSGIDFDGDQLANTIPVKIVPATQRPAK